MDASSPGVVIERSRLTIASQASLGANLPDITVLSGAAGRIDVFPFIPGADLEANALGVNCTTAVAGALCKLVVYDALPNGMPGILLLETNTADLSTLGNKVLTASLTLYRGRTYWLGVRHSATASLSAWALPLVWLPLLPLWPQIERLEQPQRVLRPTVSQRAPGIGRRRSRQRQG